MTPERQLQVIGHAIDKYHDAQASDEGDKHLASAGYLIEAISAALDDDIANPVLRRFMAGIDG